MSAAAILAPMLLALAWFDLRERRLPDALTLPLLVAGILVTATTVPEVLLDHLVGVLAGAIIAWSVRAIHTRLTGRIGLGLGDVKLIAAAGAWVGWQGLPEVVLIGCVSAVVVLVMAEKSFRVRNSEPGTGINMGSRGEMIPFGAHLCLGLAVVWAAGPWLAG